jgi:hypothetical protein
VVNGQKKQNKHSSQFSRKTSIYTKINTNTNTKNTNTKNTNTKINKRINIIIMWYFFHY